MSEFSIRQYQNELEKIIHFGGSNKETSIRNAFYNLLNEYARAKGLIMVTEIDIKATNSNKKVRPDGTLKDSLRQDWGYWESKDESDNIDDEIEKKFEKGYPKENILFEDSQTAVLIQNGYEVLRVEMKDVEALHRIITAFINFERPEVQHFRKAIELFKEDIPKVTETLRGIIIAQEKTNPQFIKSSEAFLRLCHDSINPNITNDDVREMIIQHILTEDVFNTIFDENQFHRENNIARELESVIHTFFTGSLRKTALGSVQHYYQAINAAAAGIADHHEKQKFLKVIYETFYKSYNPKAADRLGVVYTPNEIVQFMIKSTDYLLNKHFNKFLEDKGVEILDPATGTGTFMCDMIDYISKDKLKYKYKNEMHANEVAILPYYISNLNIEFTYTQKMGSYEEFENLCFVDTLDNMGFAFRGKQIDMFSPFSEENSKRIKNQNEKRIAVIIGNPPYNANQVSENDNNKNREYPIIDKRIKDTFIENSTAQKTKVYDMYARFYRWAFDRLDNNGIIAFITNRSFINSRTFDGFRKTVGDEFDFAYIIDTKSDIRSNPKLSGTTHNVFGIQTGVAVMFLVKKVSKTKRKNCNIFYNSMEDEWRKEIKLQWFSENEIQQINFTHIQPDKNNNWIDNVDNDWETMLPLDKFFNFICNGVATGRDEWVYDMDYQNLENKIKYIVDHYNLNLGKPQFDLSIKWTEKLKLYHKRNVKLDFDNNRIVKANYRPFNTINYYGYSGLSDRLTENHKQLNGNSYDKQNLIIVFTTPSSQKPFMTLAAKNIVDWHFVGAACGSACAPLNTFDENDNKIGNITDYVLNKFTRQFGKNGVSKESIFYYIYAVLHNPAYRIKYEVNLKREFPRIPFYSDFNAWSNWGKLLITLHSSFESVERYKLDIINLDSKVDPKPRLKSEKESNSILIDENTTLTNLPTVAWEYVLGNRTAIDWILEEHKEVKLKDQTIANNFNSYKFSDYKERVIELIERVCTLSVETIKIVEEMKSVM